eukprot:RCo023654
MGSVPSGLSRESTNPEATPARTPQPEVSHVTASKRDQDQPPEKAPPPSASLKASQGQRRKQHHHEAQFSMAGGALAETPSAAFEGEDELSAGLPAAEVFRHPSRASPPPSSPSG